MVARSIELEVLTLTKEGEESFSWDAITPFLQIQVFLEDARAYKK